MSLKETVIATMPQKLPKDLKKLIKSQLKEAARKGACEAFLERALFQRGEVSLVIPAVAWFRKKHFAIRADGDDFRVSWLN